MKNCIIRNANGVASLDDIERNYTLHHSAWYRGYVSRKLDGIAEPYNGRFGCGWKIFRPSWASTTYCHVEYWVEEVL